jgi:YHS domain-containing protein
MPTRRSLILTALAVTLLPPLARAQSIFTDDGVALRGYDPVAYFTEGAPVRGRAEHAADWAGARWHFASAANRAAFLDDPEAFAPQYGGYCAWAVARGYTAPVDPTAWRIVDGRLYLNFDARIQRRWERDIPGFIAAADANWPALAD